MDNQMTWTPSIFSLCSMCLALGKSCCVQPVVMIVVTIGLRTAFPLAPLFCAYTILDYCSLSIIEQKISPEMFICVVLVLLRFILVFDFNILWEMNLFLDIELQKNYKPY